MKTMGKSAYPRLISIAENRNETVEVRSKIADVGADPFCIDTGAVNEGDAPVYCAEHGMGEWDFELYANSFQDFLESL